MDVVAQTGVCVCTSLHDLSRSDQSPSNNWHTEEEWAEERRRLLEELRRRKTLRRGGSQWVCPGDDVYDLLPDGSAHRHKQSEGD